MDDEERYAGMAKVLSDNERRMREEVFEQTQRGVAYLEAGLPKDTLLAALGISLRTWERRLTALRTRYETPVVEYEVTRRARELDAILRRGGLQ